MPASCKPSSRGTWEEQSNKYLGVTAQAQGWQIAAVLNMKSKLDENAMSQEKWDKSGGIFYNICMTVSNTDVQFCTSPWPH